MKHFLLLTLLLLTACWKTPQNSEYQSYTNNLYQEFLPKSSWADLRLHGKVKKLTEYSYYLEYADNGQIQQGALSTIVPAKVEAFFTSQGRISTQLFYSADNIAYPEATSYYHYFNGKIDSIFTINMGEVPNTSAQAFKYDLQGNLIQHRNYVNGRKILTTYYQAELTPQGTLLTERESEGEELSTSKTLHYYDARGLKYREALYEGNKLLSQLTFESDLQGRRVKCRFEGMVGDRLKSTTTFTYDLQGNLTSTIDERKHTDEQMLLPTKTSYQYDPHGNILRAYHISDAYSEIRTYEIGYF